MQQQHAAEVAMAGKAVGGLAMTAAALGPGWQAIAVASVVAVLAAITSLHWEAPAKGTEVWQVVLRVFAFAVVGVLSAVIFWYFPVILGFDPQRVPLWAFAGIFSIFASSLIKRGRREAEKRAAPGA
jgi:hypothetical protein